MGDLLNLVGSSTGVVLYAMLLAMVLRSGRAGARTASVDPLLVLTSCFGLTWNVSTLAVYELPRIGLPGPWPWLSVFGFGSLGFLPAVVVHSVLRGERDELRGPASRGLAYLAYAISACALLLQVWAAATGAAVPSHDAMRLLTISFVALVPPLVLATRGQLGARRALWMAALAVFAVSAFHLGQLHTVAAWWPMELVGHQASLPLALAILYQDYPFAFADLFLKRALALLSLTGLAVGAVAAASSWLRPGSLDQQDPRGAAGVAAFWAATTLLYPRLRRTTAWFVDAIVLRRPDYNVLRGSIGERLRDLEDESSILDETCRRLAPAMSATTVTWREGLPAREAPERPTATIVAVPTTDAPQFAIELGGLTGGRRLLSDDLEALEAVALLVARRLDAVRLGRERFERETREQEIRRLATEAELRALRAQLNPHFLFNALTTIGYLIQTAPPRALETLLHLTALLRGILRSDGEFATLGHELEMVEAYLDIERARFEERLRVVIDVPHRLLHMRVPPLVLQPLVENAVKHGIAPIQRGGEVIVRASVDEQGPGAQQLVLSVHDSGAGTSVGALEHGRRDGIGLRNIERRLQHQYGLAASLTFDSAPGHGTLVEVRLPVDSGSTVEFVP